MRQGNLIWGQMHTYPDAIKQGLDLILCLVVLDQSKTHLLDEASIVPIAIADRATNPFFKGWGPLEGVRRAES